MRHLVSSVVVALAVLIALSSVAPAAVVSGSDAKGLDALGEAFREAFSNADAKAVANLFTADADFIDASGRIVRGREAIERDFEGFFAVHGKAQMKMHRVALRFLAPEVAMIDGVSEMIPAPIGPPSVSHFTVIAVKKNGRWLMQNVRENVTYPPSHYEHLVPLEWMIGSWSYGGGDSRIREANVNCQWTQNKNYILRKHELTVEGEGTVSGTQRIGWNPVTEKIHSWMFTSAGGCIEGVWEKDGNRWIVTSSGFLGNGKKVTSKNIVTLVNDTTFTFQSVDRTIDGEPTPDVDVIEIKRK